MGAEFVNEMADFTIALDSDVDNLSSEVLGVSLDGDAEEDPLSALDESLLPLSDSSESSELDCSSLSSFSEEDFALLLNSVNSVFSGFCNVFTEWLILDISSFDFSSDDSKWRGPCLELNVGMPSYNFENVSRTESRFAARFTLSTTRDIIGFF